jgi:hypothetical protein
MNDERRNMLLDEFFIVKRQYNAFSRFAFICKFKKAKILVDHDLYLNPISERDDKQRMIALYDEKNQSKYLFLLRDIVHIVNTSLSNAYYLFPEPKEIKNPYNNLAFTKAQLYNIYFALKMSYFAIPELFHCYFYTHFCLNMFSQKYETVVRENVILNYVRKSSHILLYQNVLSMIYFYAPKKMYDNIHEDFPEKVLVETFRPYLYLYFIGDVNSTTLLSSKSILLLKAKLRQFFKLNPKFGRKYVHVIFKNGRVINEVSFNRVITA